MKTFLISIAILITSLFVTPTASASKNPNMIAPPINDLIENAIDIGKIQHL